MKQQGGFSSNSASLFTITPLYFFWWPFTWAVKNLKLYIHGILFFKPYKVSAEKALRTCLSWHWKVAQSLKESWLVVSNTWRIWWILTHSLRGLKIWHPWDLLSKVYKVWTETVQRSYFSWHWTVMQIYSKPWPCRFWLAFLSKAYYVSPRTFQGNYVSWHWSWKRNSKENWLVVGKMT